MWPRFSHQGQTYLIEPTKQGLAYRFIYSCRQGIRRERERETGMQIAISHFKTSVGGIFRREYCFPISASLPPSKIRRYMRCGECQTLLPHSHKHFLLFCIIVFHTNLQLKILLFLFYVSFQEEDELQASFDEAEESP